MLLYRICQNFIVCALCLAIVPENAAAQQPETVVTKALKQLRTKAPDLRASVDRRTGLPTRLRNLEQLQATRSLGVSAKKQMTPADVRDIVDAFFALRELRAAFPQGNVATKRVYKTIEPDRDLPGGYVAELAQEVNGIPVFGSTARLTVSKKRLVTGLSASFSSVDLDDTNATLSKEDAVDKARAALKKKFSSRQRKQFGLDRRSAETRGGISMIETAKAEVSKIIFDPKLFRRGTKNQSKTRLAWLVTLGTYKAFIDAKTGDLLYYFRDHQSFTVRRVFQVRKDGQLPGEEVINEETGIRSAKASAGASAAYQNSGIVRDYFFGFFGRKSFDDGSADAGNFGAAILSYVGVPEAAGGAYWCKTKGFSCPDANVAVYGAGTTKALDVMAHEFTHGIIDHTAKLIYAHESGAVNESLADIFGSLIELNAKVDGGNWDIGETLPGRDSQSPERSMSNPKLADNSGKALFDPTQDFDADTNHGQPDSYDDYVTSETPICESTTDFDNGCVHFNSGILNKFAYLIANGGTHNGVEVKGIGTQKLAVLAYRTMTTKLAAASTLPDAAMGFLDSCNEFVRAEARGLTSDDCQQIQKAQDAVRLVVPGV